MTHKEDKPLKEMKSKVLCKQGERGRDEEANSQ
jgi:hypothetical protein